VNMELSMSDHREKAIQYVREHKEDNLSLLKDFVGLPSVSTDPAYIPDVLKAAEWVAERLRGLGMNNVKIYPTVKHPVVYGEWLEAKNAPTVLIYGHYDVQPIDPIELWKSEPFTGSVMGEYIFGRGASDMKGQDVAVMSAVEAIVRTGKFPVNIKWMIEGEEEIGSPSLEKFITNHKEMLACDFALNPDSGMVGADFPSITYGLRGLAAFELKVFGPTSDLHSGLFGGVVHNPAVAMAELIAGMHDANGRITLPGFYDNVRSLSAKEKGEMARLPTDETYYLEMTGVPALWGEKGFSPAERVGARPTLEVNGMTSGYTGPGFKTVLPSFASAKISMRLVPDQDPEKVAEQLRAYLEQRAPRTIRWELEDKQGGPASISNLDNPGVVALGKALETVWGKKAILKREGGSVPVVAQMQRLLGVESVCTGFGLPDDNLHAPNERQHLPTWYRGIETMVHFFFNLK
jgi:acetylornithine deacetylase/succinyl-diaminopimelate desuccinylase-like protein